MSATIEGLKDSLRQLAPAGVALAYSGGVDSTLLLAILSELQKEKTFPFWAVTFHSIFQTEDELEEIRCGVAAFSVNWRVVECNPLTIAEVRHNPVDRCYWCKRHLFSELFAFAGEKNLACVMDGTNGDDLHVYRPGRKALKELGVVSPLAKLGITKKEIRAMAVELKLRCASKPAAPCMATRFVYGTELTEDAVRRVAAGEALLHRMFPEAENVRLRVHDSIARIEVDRTFLPTVAAASSAVTAELKSLGFAYVTLDLEGFRSGSMDIGLTIE